MIEESSEWLLLHFQCNNSTILNNYYMSRLWNLLLEINWIDWFELLNIRPMFGCGCPIGVPEENWLLGHLKKRKLAKYGPWKRRSKGLVIAVTEGELERKCISGRRRTAWIEDVRRWTEGGLPAAWRIALNRLWQMWTETQNIVVICPQPYKGYGLLGEGCGKYMCSSALWTRMCHRVCCLTLNDPVCPP